MKVLTKKLVSAFRKVAQIREHMATYCLHGKDVPVYHQELHWAVMDFYSLRIEIHKVAPGGEELRGLLLRRPPDHEKPTQIAITINQPEPWARFVQAKELSQIIIDEAEDWSVDGAQTLERYIYETRVENDDAPDGVVQSESIAMCAAMEIMYPYDLRQHDAAEFEAGKTTLSKLALHYDLPQNIIGRALHPSYMELSTKIWDLVKK